PDWNTLRRGERFYTAPEPTDPNIGYSEAEGRNIGRLKLANGERTSLQKPNRRPRLQIFEDSILIERPDTTKPPTSTQQKRLADLRRRQLADSAEVDLRWNWNTPFFLSPHSPTTFYAGSNKVMKSTNRGENLSAISPDLTTR